MPSRLRLGASPVEVSPLAVGCWAWGDQEFWGYGDDYGQTEVVDAFRTSLDAGLDFFDTAEAYAWGKGEKLLGAMARRSGQPAIVASKFAPLAGRGGPQAIAKGLDGSLKRLGLAQIDLYQMHWADRDEAPIPAAMNAFADAVEAGKVRAVGVSNFSASEMREAHSVLAARGIPLASNQVHYSLLHRAPEVDGVLETCRELDVTLLAYSPLEQGVLTGKYRPGMRPARKRGDVGCFRSQNLAAAQPLIERLAAIGSERGVEPASVALAWLMKKPGVIPIAGAKTATQAAQNAKALQLELSDADCEALDALSLGWRTAQRQ